MTGMDPTRRVVAGWILGERLGRGGFGEVWKARRPQADLLRALKLVPVASERAFLAWRQEINRLDELSHPNIVRFYDADIVADPGPYEDFAWIATELCERSLADELDARPQRVLRSDEVAEVATAMLGALAAAHGSGCVHRDVKPGNILLHRSGVWKLCDFGTARLVPPGESHPRTDVVGTFPYMSPAAHRGRQDAAADLYALGVTLHEAACGVRLHPRLNGMTDSEYVKFILDTPPVISPQLDPVWHGLVAALIGLDGPHTAHELLTRFSDTTVITVRQPRTAGSPAHPDPELPMSGRAPSQLPVSATTPESTPSSAPTRQQPRSPATKRQQQRPSGGGREYQRSPSSSRERRHVLGLLGIIAASLVVAGVLLFQALPAAVAAGIVAAVLLAVVLLIALS